MSCPHCDSADVRPSRHSRGLDRIGLHRYRCRACGRLFWLRGGRIEAVRARRREYLETQTGAVPPATLGELGQPPVTLGELDQSANAPAPAADLRALDLELARRRSEIQPP